MIYPSTVVFDGRKLAAEKEKILQAKTAQISQKLGFLPKLIAISVGHDPASEIYLRLKGKVAARVGVDFERKEFPENVDPQEVIDEIKRANQDKKVWGIMVQLPLPPQSAISNPPAGEAGQQSTILEAIDPEKDVDCLTPENLGLVLIGQSRFLPATVKAVITILQKAELDGKNLAGKNVCVVGGSNIVGKPLALALSNLGATVSICRSRTKNLVEFTSRAEILISATGIPGLIKKEMVKKGAVVIDVGSPKGDVDFEQVQKVVSFITPVPGGVGPLTVISLLENLIDKELS